jgi:hypothetical protein
MGFLLCSLGCLLVSISFFLGTSAQKTVGDLFWQLQDLDRYAPTGNPYLGGQNATYCCLKAVNQSLSIDENGQLVLLNDWIILQGNASKLIDANARGEFPCGASYNGDSSGAPIVQVNYTWLADQCPGWQRSGQGNLNAWLQPLSGFLLPAVIFCLSVPRRRKLHVYHGFFLADLAGVKGYIPAILGAIGALILVTLDTIIWLSTCFAFSGPMILSGLYEALLDNRILEFLRVKIRNQKLTLDMRCRCLMIILIGNLDLALDKPREQLPERVRRNTISTAVTRVTSTATSKDVKDNEDSKPMESFQPPLKQRAATMPHMVGLQHLPQHRPEDTITAPPLYGAAPSTTSPAQRPSRPNTPVNRPSTKSAPANTRASPWRHMEELLYGIRLYDDEDSNRNLSPRQNAKHTCFDGPHCRDHSHVENPHFRTAKTERQVRKTKTRLRTMLHCQYSFGSMVGAPVIFFLGGFVFALLQSLEGLGDEDTAEGLAFGMWYMTIPHIAIISGLLLAGNNPNILEGVFATEREDKSDDVSILGLRFELAYPSCYKVAWQWLRGPTKKKWISKVTSTYGTRHDFNFHDPDPDMRDLQAVTTLSPIDWFQVLCMTFFLIGIPYILAFLTAFYTPEIGLACRSLTFTVYFCLELAQIILWLWAYAGPPPMPRVDGGSVILNFFRRDGWLHRSGFFEPTRTDWLLGLPGHRKDMQSIWESAQSNPSRTFWCLQWYFLAAIFGIMAIFASLGGTLMQLMGVYSGNICHVTVDHWFQPYEDRPKVIISSNSQDMILSAQGKPLSLSP